MTSETTAPALNLYPFQKRWVQDDARFKIAMFARQCGKTFTSTLELVLDCLRDTRPHPTHLTLDRALAYMKEITPRRGYFIHMCHDVKHAEFEARLPRWIRLTYDGMKIRV